MLPEKNTNSTPSTIGGTAVLFISLTGGVMVIISMIIFSFGTFSSILTETPKWTNKSNTSTNTGITNILTQRELDLLSKDGTPEDWLYFEKNGQLPTHLFTNQKTSKEKFEGIPLYSVLTADECKKIDDQLSEIKECVTETVLRGALLVYFAYDYDKKLGYPYKEIFNLICKIPIGDGLETVNDLIIELHTIYVVKQNEETLKKAEDDLDRFNLTNSPLRRHPALSPTII